jgi:hypothetical protein
MPLHVLHGRLYGVKEVGGKKTCTGVHVAQKRRPHWMITDSGVQNGAGVKYILEIMASTLIDIAEQDVTIVVSMLSKMKKIIDWWAEDCRVVVEILRSRVHLRQLERPTLVFGGSARLWSYTNNWDHLVEKVVAVTRAPWNPMRLLARATSRCSSSLLTASTQSIPK